MTELHGKAPMEPKAVYLSPPNWIGGKPSPQQREDVVWQGVGTDKVPLQARRDGFIIFEFDKSPAYAGGDVPEGMVIGADRKIPKAYTAAENARVALAYKRFDYMNAFLAALYSAYSTVQKFGTPVQKPVTPTNYFVATVENGKWVFRQEFERNFKYPPDRRDTDVATIAHAVELMEHCQRRFGESYIDILKLTYLACHQYSIHQFDSAHIVAWTVVEKLLTVMWEDYLRAADRAGGGSTAINKDRRKTLSGRDYTASVRTQVLSLAGKLDDELLERMDAARRKRNNFAHSLEPIGDGDAGKVIRVATDLITNLTGFRVTSQLSLSYYI